MGVTTSLPSAVQLTEIGDSYTESGTTTIVANSGTTTVNFDDSVISVTSPVAGSISSGQALLATGFNTVIGPLTVTAVGAGSTTLEFVSQNTSVAPTVSSSVTVGAVAEDESYLNKRGLTHFWENIDDLKQDTLTAGTGISITNNVISATGGGVADSVAWGHVTGTLADQTDLNTALGAKANSADLATVATSGDYDDLTDKPTIGNATLTIQKNGTSAGTFTANATSNKTINITVPTTAADVSALPASTKYGASIAVSINTTDYKVTTTLKDQDGNTLGTAQVIDLPLESVVVNGSYDSTNKKIVLTLQNGNTIDIPVGDLVAGLQSEITSTNKLASDLVDDTNQTHKFMTSAEKTKLSGIAAGAEVNVQSDWNQTTTTADDYIKNKPQLAAVATSGAYSDLSGTPSLATVATSGSYNDLSNKPTIPAAQVNSDWNSTSGVSQILNKPTLATVATSGSYNDLSNKPTIPTVNNATLTIQKNGTNVQTFTANQSTNATANITVPTKVSDLTNDSGFITSSGTAAKADQLTTGRTIAIGTGATGTATSFDGSSNITIPITNVKSAYVTWGGKDIVGDITPDDAGCTDEFGHNKLAYLPAECIQVWRSLDGGSSWVLDSGLSDATKIALVTTSGSASPIYAGSTGGTVTADNITKWRSRIRIACGPANSSTKLYTALKKILINFNTNGAGSCKIKMRRRTIANYLSNTETWEDLGTHNINGWSGWNSYPYSGNFGGSMTTQTGQWGQIEFEFWGETYDSRYSCHCAVLDIRFIGTTNWTMPSEMARVGHLYKIDTSQNAEFPANVKVTGSLQHDSYTYTLPNKNGTVAMTSDLPAAQVNSDWDASSGVAQILNKPTLATVATSGSYNDLSNKPTIPAAQVQSNWTQTTTTAVDYIKNKPNLATVATSGSYNDLSNKPTIPTVNNATLTITQNGTSAGTFTANASSNKTIALTDTTYSDATTSASGLMSAADKTKLNGIATGAEVNQNAFSNVKVGSTTVAADAKTDTLELVAGSNVTLTPDATNDKVTIAATDTTYSNATTSASGLMSASDKTKLNGIASGAEVNVQANWTQTTTTADDYIKNKPTLATVATSGSYNDLSNKPTIPTVNNATLTIQKNGTTVKTFTANASSNVTANITVPTALSDLSGTISTSQIADSAVTPAKIDLSSLFVAAPTISSQISVVANSYTDSQTMTLSAGTWQVFWMIRGFGDSSSHRQITARLAEGSTEKQSITINALSISNSLRYQIVGGGVVTPTANTVYKTQINTPMASYISTSSYLFAIRIA